MSKAKLALKDLEPRKDGDVKGGALNLLGGAAAGAASGVTTPPPQKGSIEINSFSWSVVH